jgi:hypothetical protein
MVGRLTVSQNSQPVYLVDLAHDCLEVRLDGFAEWRKPYGRAAIEQGTAKFAFQSPDRI